MKSKKTLVLFQLPLWGCHVIRDVPDAIFIRWKQILLSCSASQFSAFNNKAHILMSSKPARMQTVQNLGCSLLSCGPASFLLNRFCSHRIKQTFFSWRKYRCRQNILNHVSLSWYSHFLKVILWISIYLLCKISFVTTLMKCSALWQLGQSSEVGEVEVLCGAYSLFMRWVGRV